MTSKFKTDNMWVFKKGSAKKGPEVQVSMQDRLAVKLAGLVLKLQAVFARKMDRLFGKVSPSRMKRLLFLFCAATCLLSSYFIIKALKSDGGHDSFRVDQSKTPGFFDKTGEAPIDGGIPIDEESFYKLQLFRRYMDSLKLSDPSRFDSIQRQRPGLMDSLATLENLYYSQKIK